MRDHCKTALLRKVPFWKGLYDLMHRLSYILKYLRKIINIGALRKVQVDIGWRNFYLAPDRFQIYYNLIIFPLFFRDSFEASRILTTLKPARPSLKGT